MSITLVRAEQLGTLYSNSDADTVGHVARFDSLDSQQKGWVATADYTSAFAPTEGAAILGSLSEELLGAFTPQRGTYEFTWTSDKIARVMEAGIRLVPYAPNRSGGDTTLTFERAGYRERAALSYQSRCR